MNDVNGIHANYTDNDVTYTRDLDITVGQDDLILEDGS